MPKGQSLIYSIKENFAAIGNLITAWRDRENNFIRYTGNNADKDMILEVYEDSTGPQDLQFFIRPYKDEKKLNFKFYRV